MSSRGFVSEIQSHGSSDSHTPELWEDKILLSPWWLVLGLKPSKEEISDSERGASLSTSNLHLTDEMLARNH